MIGYYPTNANQSLIVFSSTNSDHRPEPIHDDSNISSTKSASNLLAICERFKLGCCHPPKSIRAQQHLSICERFKLGCDHPQSMRLDVGAPPRSKASWIHGYPLFGGLRPQKIASPDRSQDGSCCWAHIHNPCVHRCADHVRCCLCASRTCTLSTVCRLHRRWWRRSDRHGRGGTHLQRHRMKTWLTWWRRQRRCCTYIAHGCCKVVGCMRHSEGWRARRNLAWSLKTLHVRHGRMTMLPIMLSWVRARRSLVWSLRELHVRRGRMTTLCMMPKWDVLERWQRKWCSWCS